LPLSLILLSGCSWRKDRKSQPSETPCAVEKLPDIEERTSIFDEHEGRFELEESTNPFAPHNGDIELVDAPLWEDQQNSELEPAYFEFDQYKISPQQQPVIDRNIAKIKPKIAPKDAFLVVEGHACKSAGTPRYNTMLSERRAQEVKKLLVKKGIPANKIKTVGYGSEKCIVAAGNREQQAPNRRVEFRIVHLENKS
jgi:outer membrane protein OmpA-like peptidoglycan-associated protein